MSQKLTCLQAYRAMLRCFDTIYFQTYDDDISFLVGNAALYSANSDPLIQPETMDPAVWHDWMKAVQIAMGDSSLTFSDVEMTVDQAYQASGQYFAIHCDIGLFENIGKLRDLLRNDVINPELSRWLRHKWDQALVTVLHEPLPEKTGHFFGALTPLTQRESFVIMQFYLNNICQKNQNQDLVGLLQRSRILNYHSNYWQDEPDLVDPIVWQLWVQALELVLPKDQNKTLNLMVAYKAMAKFLSLYFHDNNLLYIGALIKHFDNIDEYDTPMVDDNWLAFSSATVEVNAQQTEIVNNLVSINTPIFSDVAKKMIVAWFEKYQLNLDWIEYFDQAFEIIKQRKRSYLLLDGEITVLETYHIMLLIVDAINQVDSNENLNAFLQQNAIGQQNGKPIDFIQLLEWIKCAEQIC